MYFRCMSNTTFFLIFETCQTYYWAKTHFQTCENSTKSLKLGGIFADVSVNLTLQFIENLSPETWSSTEMRRMWFCWTLQLLLRVCICPSVVWAWHVQQKSFRGSPGSSLEKQWEQRKIIKFTRLPLQPVSVVPSKGMLGSLQYEMPVPHQRKCCTSVTSVHRQKPVREDGGSRRRSSSGWRKGTAQEIPRQGLEMCQQFHWSCSRCWGALMKWFFLNMFSWRRWLETSWEQVCLRKYPVISGFSSFLGWE